MVRLENVDFSYPLKGGALPVLSGITARFERGGITAIVGRSGCGKTSLLRIIAGLSAPSSGRLDVDGVSGGVIREKTSIIFQDFGLLPWANVQTNAELGLRVRKVRASDRKARVDPILAELGLCRFVKLYPRDVRAARQESPLARALASDSDLILLDERSPVSMPSRGIHSRNTAEDQRWARDNHYFVTHSFEEALILRYRLRLCGRTLDAFHTVRYRRRPWPQAPWRRGRGLSETAARQGESGCLGQSPTSGLPRYAK